MREATRAGASAAELESGYSVTVAGKIAREIGRAAKKAGASWAACVRKVFEVDPILCAKCGGEMKLVAVILDDRELDRVLAHEGWPAEFPRTKASRSPPGRGEGEGSQANARADSDDGRQESPSEWPRERGGRAAPGRGISTGRAGREPGKSSPRREAGALAWARKGGYAVPGGAARRICSLILTTSSLSGLLQ